FFKITVSGAGCHAAMPDLGHDPFVAVSQLLAALQAVPSRRFSASDALVISVTQVHGGSAYNVIPDEVVIKGTVRALRAGVRDSIEGIFNEIGVGIGAATNTRIETDYRYSYPVTVNHAEETEYAAGAAAALVGADNVKRDMSPSMGAEDFAFMLQARPGAYVWLGNGVDSAPLHNPCYDFNDDILTTGAAYWASLVQRELAA
ncbi:MAG TPA: M20/M25/M40 family metallo-hydrolase, partial [Salinisphaeraceae bacterium]|nr:M20/M25/M40 family metallo-hydrolase [Salinisphaeraceae bacterium]